jgi:hypothetical protein
LIVNRICAEKITQLELFLLVDAPHRKKTRPPGREEEGGEGSLHPSPFLLLQKRQRLNK